MENPHNLYKVEPLRKVDRLVIIPVDVTNDFCTGGSLPVPNGEDVVTPLNQLITFTREHGGIVVPTRESHPDTTPHFDAWPKHGIDGTWGAEFRDDLALRFGDIVINKGMGQTDGYSGFEGVADDGQTLESIIMPVGDERVAVLIGGLATDYCVKNTVLDALKLAEKVRQERVGMLTIYAIVDAMRAVDIKPADGKDALYEMRNAGAVLASVKDILNKRFM